MADKTEEVKASVQALGIDLVNKNVNANITLGSSHSNFTIRITDFPDKGNDPKAITQAMIAKISAALAAFEF